MDRNRFNRTLQELTHRRREVLLEVLAGKSDAAISGALNITEATVRKHIENICNQFEIANEFPDERRSKRPDLIALFRKYQPEFVREKTPDLQFKEAISPEAKASLLGTIYNRDVFVLIDRSGSMVRKDGDTRGLARYKFLQEEVESHVWTILSTERRSVEGSLQKICDRLSVYFFCRDKVGAGPYEIKDASQVQELFHNHPPKGNTFITPTLRQCFKTWIEGGKPKNRGAFFIIYTDGLFDDESNFIQFISEACLEIYDHRQIKFLILGLGEEIDVRHFLSLDFNVNQKNEFNTLVFDRVNEVDNIIDVLQRQLVENPDLVFPDWVLDRYPEFVKKVMMAKPDLRASNVIS
ncbi:RNA polymerase subunit sigma-70 [Oscillatoriales cyanobacterium LEGE 11467]|uniref:RNA polymerase subunit sigma-70 n=1 Tax=Zarconia navalis LEGE 11467 TaxID=1828826 RepID=A0A928VYJ1_9CYAN|nr:LuxR C-terminal-related transcriptional regulator [Zarconia navalis]MBE9041162.1 RNA polymerase subunit sigma-70 [Zarconia navalis LEGE 11467]